ncbi:MAG: hypothetical protein FWF05_08720 [Oscillospiraceae bacterium]|nr:hypothetical protein [Oscillospiraceae bacterium]
MKYRNAAERLPACLLAELQRHAPGELLYVPAKQRQTWGEIHYSLTVEEFNNSK